jgi:hypothetical protein
MRFAIAVLVAATLDLAVLLRVDQWLGVGAVLALGYLLVASAGAGFFAARRGALAGALTVIVGALLSGIVQYWPRIGYANDLGTLLVFELQLVIALVPYEVGGAIAGYAGDVARRRVLRPGRAMPVPTKPPSNAS